MNGLKKSMVVTLLAATALWPRLSSAMEIQQFDKMAREDQQHYLAFLAKEVQKVLIEQGRRDLAVRVSHLFQDIPLGEDRSVGEAQFELELAAARAYSAKDAVTIAKNGRSKLCFGVFRVAVKSYEGAGVAPSPGFGRNHEITTVCSRWSESGVNLNRGRHLIWHFSTQE